MKHSNSLIVHGKKLSKLLEEWGVEPRKIEVLPHGNFSILRKIGKNELGKPPRNYVLFFGKIKPYKGVETIIRAVPIIKKEIRDVLIVVAGFGEINEYLSLINEEDLKNFEFLNYYIADEDIPLLFQNAAVVVLPYTSASQSGVLSLAYTFGRPVLVSSVGSMCEYVDNKKTGFIFKPNDHGSLAKIIVKMLKNRKLREKMELNCYKKAFSDLSWEKIANNTYEIYKRASALCTRCR